MLDADQPKRLERSRYAGGLSPRLKNYLRLLTADVNIHASGVDAGEPRGRNTHAPGCSCRPLVPDVRGTHRTCAKHRRCDHRTSSASSSAANNPNQPIASPWLASIHALTLSPRPPTQSYSLSRSIARVRQSFSGSWCGNPGSRQFSLR